MVEKPDEEFVKENIGPSICKRYELLINARNFHYENYNKWMTYFYLAISSIFIAYFTVSAKESVIEDKAFIENSLLLLGYIISLLWYWSCKGYYYWNINFITLVNHYENDLFQWPINERIYSVFANKETQNNYWSPVGGANVSTSKIAILFSFIIANFWGFLFINKLLGEIERFQDIFGLIIFMGISTVCVITLTLTAIIPKLFLFSKIDHFPDLEIKQKLMSRDNNS